eukprot:6187902-Pleurochrysis_carterae.AAC.2
MRHGAPPLPPPARAVARVRGAARRPRRSGGPGARLSRAARRWMGGVAARRLRDGLCMRTAAATGVLACMSMKYLPPLIIVANI